MRTLYINLNCCLLEFFVTYIFFLHANALEFIEEKRQKAFYFDFCVQANNNSWGKIRKLNTGTSNTYTFVMINSIQKPKSLQQLWADPSQL